MTTLLYVKPRAIAIKRPRFINLAYFSLGLTFALRSNESKIGKPSSIVPMVFIKFVAIEKVIRKQ